MSDHDITRLLNSVDDPEANDALYRIIYNEIKGIARKQLRAERSGHTLQTTALAHEVYLKLVDQTRSQWQNRAHFFAIASRATRRILVDYARSRDRKKRGDGAPHVPLELAADVPGQDSDVDIVALDDALTRLKQEDAAKAQVVELRFFGGLNNEEIASVLNVSTRTVERHWVFARAWLFRALSDDQT